MTLAAWGRRTATTPPRPRVCSAPKLAGPRVEYLRNLTSRFKETRPSAAQLAFGEAPSFGSAERTFLSATDWETGLQAMSKLAQGWDGYDADPPSDMAVETARRIAEFLSMSSLTFRIAASVVGGVGITLCGDRGSEVYIEVYNDANVYVMLSRNTDEPDIFPHGTNSDVELRELVSRASTHLGG